MILFENQKEETTKTNSKNLLRLCKKATCKYNTVHKNQTQQDMKIKVLKSALYLEISKARTKNSKFRKKSPVKFKLQLHLKTTENS